MMRCWIHATGWVKIYDVETCDDCPWLESVSAAASIWRCYHEENGVRELPSDVDTLFDPPPEWCPLRSEPTLVQLRRQGVR